MNGIAFAYGGIVLGLFALVHAVVSGVHWYVRPACFSQPDSCEPCGSWWVQWITPPRSFHS
jgi:hypothetical protein